MLTQHCCFKGKTMSQILRKELLNTINVAKIDTGKVAEIQTHELLQKDNEGVEEKQNAQIATLDQISMLGNFFINQAFDKNRVIQSNKNFDNFVFADGKINLGKIAFGISSDLHFPVFFKPIFKNNLIVDLELYIIPVSYHDFVTIKGEKQNDKLVILAAICASAPHFLFALDQGISTTNCATKKPIVNHIKPDHALPIVATFDSFQNSNNTLKNAEAVAKHELTLTQATHLHGKNIMETQQIVSAAEYSKVTAGVQIFKTTRNQLALSDKHVIYFSSKVDPMTGQVQVQNFDESLANSGIIGFDLAMISIALGFTNIVTGDSAKEQKLEKVLKNSDPNTPMKELLS